MKSSSKHFPVALMQADYWKQFSEDVYLLKPNTGKDKTVQLALTRLYENKEGKKEQSRASFIFVHDTYENRITWISEYEEMISSILESGGDVWIYEMRGHGLSPKNQSYQTNTLYDIAKFDLPAVQTFIHELNSEPASWVGRGEGGIAILRALESEGIKSEHIKMLHLLSMERFHWARRYWIPFWGGIIRLMNRRTYFTKSRLPETEFRSVWKQLKKEKSLIGRRKSLDGKSRIFKMLSGIHTPVTFWFSSEKVNSFRKWLVSDNTDAIIYSKDQFEENLIESISH